MLKLSMASLVLLGWLGAVAGAQELIVPNENLLLEGLPPLSKTLQEQVGPYAESRGASFLSWHPRRREMLILTRFGDTPQVHQVKWPGGARTQQTFVNDKVAWAAWRPGQGDGFVLGKDRGGDENFQFYWREQSGGSLRLLTDGRSRNTGGVFSRSGRYLAYESTRRTSKDSDIYWMKPGDSSSDKLLCAREGGGWSVSDIAPDEKSLLLHHSISVNHSEIWLLELSTSQVRQILPQKNPGVPAAYSRARFTPDGKDIVFSTDQGQEFPRVYQMALASAQLRALTPPLAWGVAGFELSPDGRWLAYTVNEAGWERLQLIDLKSQRPLKLPALPGGVIQDLKFHSNSRELAFTLSSARSASDCYSLEVPSGKLWRWTESETGGLDPKRFALPSLIHWPSFDQRTIHGFLYRPPARFQGPRPVLISIHGGPESQFQPGFLGRNNYLIQELGLAMIYPNVRGSAGFGKSYLAADNGQKREDSVKDIGALLDWVATQPDLDAQRVMVMGGSYGGYMTLACMTHYNQRLRGGIDVVGISNFVTFLEKTEGYRRDLRRVEYGDERLPEMREFLERISPTRNVHKITKPMFIVQGKNDPRVPLAEAEQMVAALRSKGTPCWYLMAKDEGHGFAKKKNADFQFYATVKFIEEVLLR